MKEGYAEHFVGRRREQQRLLPALQSGDLQLLLITGLGGSGKSTLATRLARKLETYGFMPIPLSSSKENPLSSARLLQAFGEAFRKAARKHKSRGNAQKAEELAILAEDLGNARQSVEGRLHDALSALNDGQFLLLLDNFESILDEVDLHILDPEIASFYRYLLENLSGSSRAIITTRYPPSDMPNLPPKARREDLSDFSQSSFLKILQRDPEVERRIRSGALPHSLMTKLYQTFGGTPRFLLQIREALKKMDAKALKVELEQVKLPDTAPAGELQKIRDKYFQDIITDRLYSYLPPESQKALCQAAVFAIPVTLEGFSAVSGVLHESISALAGEWADRAFVYRNPERPIWIVYGLLRPWLLSKLSTEERKKAHKRAGDFLMKIEQEKRLSEIGLSWADCLMEARSQYLQAGEMDQARSVTDRLSIQFLIRGFYDGVRHLNSELLQYEEHPSPMSWIGRTYREQGDYPSAQSWYQRCLNASSLSNVRKEESVALHGLAMIHSMRGEYKLACDMFKKVLKITQQIHDLSGEGACWHALATIDLKKGDYRAAHKKFKKGMKILQQIGDVQGEASTLHNLSVIDFRQSNYRSASEKLVKSLKIYQQIGDRANEGSAFHQLGIVSSKRGHLREGIRLVATCYLIINSIGHEKRQLSFESLCQMASDLDYSKESFEAMLKEVSDSYAKDRGWSLIRAAFPEI